MTAAQVAAQMAVEAANNQKSRCELPMDSVGLCEQFMLAELLVVVFLCLHAACVTVSVHITVKLVTFSAKLFSKDGAGGCCPFMLYIFGVC